MKHSAYRDEGKELEMKFKNIRFDLNEDLYKKAYKMFVEQNPHLDGTRITNKTLITYMIHIALEKQA